MATDGNEFRERQRQRAEAKRKRERARKRMIFRLGLILAVILASALLIWLVTSGSNTPGGNTPNTPGISAGNQEATAPTERQDRTTISVTVAGDLNVNAATVGAGLTPYGYNFAHVFRDVAPLLTNADLTVLNFEGNLCGLPSGQDNASAPPEMLEALADIGVDMIQVANSYSIRNGLLGLYR